MERWSGRVAVVTGASAGIGAAIVKELVLKGMKVVGLARRVERVEELKAVLSAAPGELHSRQCDIRREADILAAFEWVKSQLGGVDVLVNNAGVYTGASVTKGTNEDYMKVLETNVVGLCACTREAVKSMKERGVDDGHIININSVCGHTVFPHPGVALYTASKYAVTAITKSLLTELKDTHIKTTSISPGLVRTEVLEVAGMSTEIYDQLPCLESKDVADSVIHVLGCGPNVMISELTIQATQEVS